MTDEGIHHALQDLVPVVVIVTMTIAATIIIKSLISAFRNRSMLRAQTELHNKILEKFSTAEEFTTYLQSDAGKTLFDNLSKEPISPLTKILGSIRKGAILTLVGIGLLLFSTIVDLSADGKITGLFFAMILTATGIGFIISAIISLRLARSWGLIPADQSTAPVAPTAVAP